MNTNVTICFLWQVIYLTDPVDEYLMQYLMEYGEEHAGAEPVGRLFSQYRKKGNV